MQRPERTCINLIAQTHKHLSWFLGRRRACCHRTVSVDLPLEDNLATLGQPRIHLPHSSSTKTGGWVFHGGVRFYLYWVAARGSGHTPGHRLRLGIQWRISLGLTIWDKKTPSSSFFLSLFHAAPPHPPCLMKQDTVKVTEMPPAHRRRWKKGTDLAYGSKILSRLKVILCNCRWLFPHPELPSLKYNLFDFLRVYLPTDSPTKQKPWMKESTHPGAYISWRHRAGQAASLLPSTFQRRLLIVPRRGGQLKRKIPSWYANLTTEAIASSPTCQTKGAGSLCDNLEVNT